MQDGNTKEMKIYCYYCVQNSKGIAIIVYKTALTQNIDKFMLAQMSEKCIEKRVPLYLE